jgi:crotonobetainyl-CoA:carnitine CoA-transferase CaiB-like acyl-CoA transferase
MLSATPVRTDRCAPRRREHSAEVLQQWLGLSRTQIAQLRNKEVI